MNTTTTTQTTTTAAAAAFTFSGAAEVSRQVSDLAKLGRKAGNMRDAVLRTVLASVTANGIGADRAADWFKGFSAEVRKARRAEASKAVLAEFDSMPNKGRAELYAMHTDTAPVMSEGCANLESWRQTWDARSSEVKTMLLASFDARHADLFAMFDAGKVTVSHVLAEIREAKAPKADAPEGTEGTEGEQAARVYDLAAWTEDLRALVRKAENAGFLADALASLPGIVAAQAATKAE